MHLGQWCARGVCGRPAGTGKIADHKQLAQLPQSAAMCSTVHVQAHTRTHAPSSPRSACARCRRPAGARAARRLRHAVCVSGCTPAHAHTHARTHTLFELQTTTTSISTRAFATTRAHHLRLGAEAGGRQGLAEARVPVEPRLAGEEGGVAAVRRHGPALGHLWTAWPCQLSINWCMIPWNGGHGLWRVCRRAPRARPWPPEERMGA